MKKLWITAMVSAKDKISQLTAVVKKFGLAMEGHIWEDDNQKMPWIQAKDAVTHPDIGLWAIVVSGEDLESPSITYGLSMLAVIVQAERGSGFPILLLQAGGEPIDPAALPTPLQAVDVLPLEDSGLGAKLVARVHGTHKTMDLEYLLNIHGNDQVGQWFELRPQHESWPGVIFGAAGAEIAFQAVGPRGKLPEKSVLEYPVQGIQLGLGEKEVVAWSVRNELDAQTAYYAKVEGSPDAIVFGPYTEGQAADLFVVSLTPRLQR